MPVWAGDTVRLAGQRVERAGHHLRRRTARGATPTCGVVIGHDCGAWIIEGPTGEVLAHRGDARRFVNSSIAAFEETRREFSSRLVAVGELYGTDEALADELESLVATIDSRTVEREDSWWHEVIDSVLHS